MPKNLPIFIFLILIISSCASVRKSQRSVDHFFTKNQLFSDHHCGFSLYDPVGQKFLYEYNGDHFFTPASNTKIITLFSALKTLPDSLPSLKYAVRNDTTYFWGLGDPTTLNPGFGDQDDNISFISRLSKNVVWCKDHFIDERFGEGWAWDDYPYSYQAEKSSFPVFGNLLHLQYHPTNSELVLYPNFCEVKFSLGTNLTRKRQEWSNRYDIGYPKLTSNISLQVPLRMSDTVVLQVFERYSKKPVTISNQCPRVDQHFFYVLPADTVYAAMMQHSDNFIAEQLLLTISAYVSDTMQSTLAIREMKKKHLAPISDQLQWYDGSGLSRYNLFTPRAITSILADIYKILSIERIKRIFASGGVSGTIANWYKNENGPPFIYAKTGTLKNVHCLSGYLLTDSGKILIFSFMHNNFPGSSNPVKSNMDKVFRHIKSHY